MVLRIEVVEGRVYGSESGLRIIKKGAEFRYSIDHTESQKWASIARIKLTRRFIEKPLLAWSKCYHKS